MTANGPVVALGFSAAARPLLERLAAGALVGPIHWPPPPPEPGAAAPGSRPPAAAWLQQHWPHCSAVLAVGACGLVVRLIAPLLQTKGTDPAVLVIDPAGRFVIPLLGGHGAGGEQLAQQLAALLGATVVTSGSSASQGLLALDAFGRQWGWRRGDGPWTPLMAAAAAARPLRIQQDCGTPLWQELAATAAIARSDAAAAALVVSHRLGDGCRWHPPCLWLGVGCERHTSLELLERLVDEGLARAQLAGAAVAGLASVDRKADEPALLELAERRGWPLRCFPGQALAAVPVPNPSAVVAQEMGTASVAEAAALLAAGIGAELLLPKRIERAQPGERGAATLAVALAPQQWAPARGALHLVGSGPGSLDLLTPDARSALAQASVWVGYGPYLDALEPLRRGDQLRRDGQLTQERERCQEALDLARQGLPVALVSSGDSGIYGMAGLALDLWLALPAGQRPPFSVHPGISALQLAAARAGAPLMHDFCAISLSDRLTPWDVIERRLEAAAAGDFVVALYNPRSQGRHWQLERARELLLRARPASTPVLLARQLGRPQEHLSLHALDDLPIEQVDMLTLVLVGNSSTRSQEGWMLTPRGYPGAALA